MGTLKDRIQQHRVIGRGRTGVFWIVGVGVALAVLITTAGFGRGDDGHRSAHGERSIAELQEVLQEHPEWLERFGLADGQVESIVQILAAHETVLGQLEDDSQSLRQQLSTALGKDSIDPVRIAELRRESKRVAAETVDELFEVTLAVSDVLTPEQRAELLTYWEKRS